MHGLFIDLLARMRRSHWQLLGCNRQKPSSRFIVQTVREAEMEQRTVSGVEAGADDDEVGGVLVSDRQQHVVECRNVVACAPDSLCEELCQPESCFAPVTTSEGVKVKLRSRRPSSSCLILNQAHTQVRTLGRPLLQALMCRIGNFARTVAHASMRPGHVDAVALALQVAHLVPAAGAGIEYPAARRILATQEHCSRGPRLQRRHWLVSGAASLLLQLTQLYTYHDQHAEVWQDCALVIAMERHVQDGVILFEDVLRACDGTGLAFGNDGSSLAGQQMLWHGLHGGKMSSYDEVASCR